LKIDPNTFFNVEYWTWGAFHALKIEIESRELYARDHF
jgi:hypothetical protein